MAYQTSMVKDLAIALEAISRINCEGSDQLYQNIAYLIQQAITKTQKEFARPEENEAPDNNDDIPF